MYTFTCTPKALARQLCMLVSRAEVTGVAARERDGNSYIQDRHACFRGRYVIWLWQVHEPRLACIMRRPHTFDACSPTIAWPFFSLSLGGRTRGEPNSLRRKIQIPRERERKWGWGWSPCILSHPGFSIRTFAKYSNNAILRNCDFGQDLISRNFHVKSAST